MNSFDATILALKFEVIRLANEMPDFVYENDKCLYTEGGCSRYPNNVGCLIGQAIKTVDYELYQYLLSNDIGLPIVMLLSDYYAYDLLSNRNKEIVRFLQNAQQIQDYKRPWIECICY